MINLYDTFSHNAPETLYFGDRDNHWNDAGQRLAAETVAPRVVVRLTEVLPRARSAPARPGNR